MGQSLDGDQMVLFTSLVDNQASTNKKAGDKRVCWRCIFVGLLFRGGASPGALLVQEQRFVHIALAARASLGSA